MIIEYEPAHLLAIQWQRGQEGFGSTEAHAKAVATSWSVKTAVQDGIVVACAGIMEVWAGRGMAWAAIDHRISRKTLLEVHRAVMPELDRAPFHRLEMYVKPGFAAAWRWAEALGFSYESTLRKGSPDGSDLFVFARLNGGLATAQLKGNRYAVLRNRSRRRAGRRVDHQRH